MEISEVVNTQFVFPGLVVGLVLICAALVFVFGFKSVEDFPFDKLATVADDRKPAGKKRKVKDKKSQSNGQATVVSETKPKNSESASNKIAVNKAKAAEKSPVKVVSKPGTKQEKKQTKVESSSVEVALKDTKNIKELNKITNDNQKEGKIKDSLNKGKQSLQSNKQGKGKGKENVDLKNKKNAEKSKLEDDEGEWEQATSRKDKKNRKSPTSDDETVTGKSVKGEVAGASPGKKKKSKSTQELLANPVSEQSPSLQVPTPVAEQTPESQKEAKDEPSKKPVKKEKEASKEKFKPVIEEATVVESAIVNDGNESENKTSKKKKKKVTSKDNSETAIPEVEDKSAVKEMTISVTKVPAPEPKQVKEPAAPPKSGSEFVEPAEPAVPPKNAPVFDELGDSWLESKPQKKASKKKVRKAE